MIVAIGKDEEIFIDDRIIIFAAKMQKELEANHEKGSIFDWNPTFEEWLFEFEYHKSKLIAALMAKEKDLINEFSADLGNYLSMLIFGSWDLQKSRILCENEKTKLI